MGTYGYIKHSELAHHGIKGQRWGVRNGPPYPLSESDRSAKERKLNPKSREISRMIGTGIKNTIRDFNGKGPYNENSRLAAKYGIKALAGKSAKRKDRVDELREGVGKESLKYGSRLASAGKLGNAIVKDMLPATKIAAGSKEHAKAVAKGYAEELAGKGMYKTTTKAIEEGFGNMLTVGSAGQRANAKASARAQEKELNNYIKSFESKKSPYVDKAFIFNKKIKDGPTMRLHTNQDNNKTANEKFKAAKEFETNFKSIKKELDKAIIPVMKKEGLDDSSINKLLSRMNNALVDTDFDNNEVIITAGYDTSGTGLPFGNNSFYVYYDPKRKKVTGAELGD